MKSIVAIRVGVMAVALVPVGAARADVVTDWNTRANDIIVAGNPGPLPANRALAIAHVAVFEALNAVSGEYPASARTALPLARGASTDAAVAAAMRGTLGKLLVPLQAEIEAVYRAALSAVPEGAEKSAGISLGEQAAATVLVLRGDDGAAAADTYVPFAAAGVYVPTTAPLAPHWGRRKPWVLAAGDQFRPPAPPALNSDTWARDYNEVKTLGARLGSRRSAEQTGIARFWEATLPAIYHPLARAVASQPGRSATRNARLFAAVGMAMDDALIAVFDAKYAYHFWRPVTAILNGDQDGNNATERDSQWLPFIDTPMHPEYPCAHCIVSAALGAVLEAEVGAGRLPVLSSTSPTTPNVTRAWNSVAEFTQEVANARIYDGVHYRNSTEVGTAMGRRVGALVASKVLQ